jgi:hypothetical protein
MMSVPYRMWVGYEAISTSELTFPTTAMIFPKKNLLITMAYHPNNH